MLPATKADVIVPLDRDPSLVLRCLRSVLEGSGHVLRHLIVVHDRDPDAKTAEALERLAGQDSRVRIVRHTHQAGYSGLCNRGLAEREGDAVLLSGDCVVGRDWLRELAEVAHSEERTACASPLTNGSGTCSVLELDRGEEDQTIDDATIPDACAGLPRWTVAPILNGSCIYLRGDVLDAVGLLELGLNSPCIAANKWVALAQTIGFASKRANHVYVHRIRSPADADVKTLASPPSGDPAERDPVYPEYLEHQIAMFCKTLDGHLAAHAVRLEGTGKLRVAYDIRLLPIEHVGTRTYAVSLARALAELPELELTLLVNDPAQAKGLRGRVVTADAWSDDVAVIHKPWHVQYPYELKLLFDSSAHVVITQLDLIGYRIPQTFSTDEEFDRYRATTGLTLASAQKIIAISENSGWEIASEFGIPSEEIAVVPLGVEAGWFAHREQRDAGACWKLGLPDRYFLSLATDFPHKNLPNLLDAYALLRRRWRDGEPPGLVLAGYTSGARTRFYASLESNPPARGLTFLGPVSRDQLRVLYQHAEALVFPSLYEGFGLPPLEAMAAGTPVIAMPISSVPEVGGDCILYPDGLSINHLARAMESVVRDERLREDLRTRGLKRVDEFRWEDTARATLQAYRSAVLRPSARSLHARRHLREGIMCWADYPHGIKAHGHPAPEPYLASEPLGIVNAEPLGIVNAEPLGIRNAWKALNFALHARLRRELGRVQPGLGRRSA